MTTGCRVYVVDDELLIARTLADILIDDGYEATFFTDPLEALSMVASGPPAFLISDVAMPGISGVELAVRVLTMYSNCRVFLMTALESIDEHLWAAGALLQEFTLLRKPFRPQLIIDALQNSLQRNVQQS
jgi:CheY-like chemotaxis protein